MPRTPSKRNIEIMEMREKGYSYQEIAEKYGITRQRAYAIIYNRTERMKEENFSQCLKSVVYPGIRNWMLKNRVTISEFHNLLNENVKSSVDTRRFLTEKSRKESIDIIRKILQVTSMTFEEAFCVEATSD